MEGPPLGTGGEDITWPDQVAPRGRKASSTRKIKPQTSNFKPSRVCGGLLRLVPQVRVSCVVLCCSVPRRVASCCGELHCGALWCGVPWSRVVPRWVSEGQPGLCHGAECGPECGWLVAGGCG